MAPVAATWCGVVRGHDIEWSSPFGVTCAIRLDFGRGSVLSLSPRAVTGGGGSLPVDAAHALVTALDAADMLRRCVSAHAALSTVVVWLDDAPCDYCSGRGHHRPGGACSVCNGAGVRKEVVGG